MCLADSLTSARNADTWREAIRLTLQLAKRIILRECASREWVKRSHLISTLHNEAAPEQLIRANLRDRGFKGQVDSRTLERQSWSGARRCVEKAIWDYSDYRVLETRGVGMAQEVRLVRLPRILP